MAKHKNSLDSHIQQVIARAVELALQAYRQDVLEGVSRAIGAATGAGTGTRRAAPAARGASSGKRTWPICSKPGCGKKFFGPSGDARLCYQHYVDAGGKHPAQAKSHGGGKAKGGRKAAPARGSRGRANNTGDGLASQALEVIGKSPGLRAEQITQHLGARPEAVKSALASLREAGKVKVAGKARGTTYTAA